MVSHDTWSASWEQVQMYYIGDKCTVHLSLLKLSTQEFRVGCLRNAMQTCYNISDRLSSSQTIRLTQWLWCSQGTPDVEFTAFFPVQNEMSKSSSATFAYFLVELSEHETTSSISKSGELSTRLQYDREMVSANGDFNWTKQEGSKNWTIVWSWTTFVVATQ